MCLKEMYMMWTSNDLSQTKRQEGGAICKKLKYLSIVEVTLIIISSIVIISDFFFFDIWKYNSNTMDISFLVFYSKRRFVQLPPISHFLTNMIACSKRMTIFIIW